MTSPSDLFLVALAERINRLWSKHLDLEVRFRPCDLLERYGVEVMVGLPSSTAWCELDLGGERGLAVIEMSLLTGAIDRQLGGRGTPEDGDPRAPTMVEEAVGRKMISKLLGGLTAIWQSYLPETGEITILDSDGTLRAPWEPRSTVIETSFVGGWPGCEGAVRFLWPRDLAAAAFGELEVKRVDVDDWRPQPWEPAVSVAPPEIVFGGRPSVAPPTLPGPMATEEVETPPPPTPEKKRIAFDDFDAMIAALNGD